MRVLCYLLICPRWCFIHAVDQFLSSTVTVTVESVGGSTPGAGVTWTTTIPPRCMTSVTVKFRNKSGNLVATNTTTNTSQTEFIKTGLQCATYMIRVVVAGEPGDQGGNPLTFIQDSVVQVLVGGKVIVCTRSVWSLDVQYFNNCYIIAQQYQFQM